MNISNHKAEGRSGENGSLSEAILLARATHVGIVEGRKGVMGQVCRWPCSCSDCL